MLEINLDILIKKIDEIINKLNELKRENDSLSKKIKILQDENLILSNKKKQAILTLQSLITKIEHDIC